MPKKKFKVGDKVEVIEPSQLSYEIIEKAKELKIPIIGTISKNVPIFGIYNYRIKFDNKELQLIANKATSRTDGENGVDSNQIKLYKPSIKKKASKKNV